VVKQDNPDLRRSWGGRAGIIVRNDISKPGQSAGFLVLGASPSNGYSLEWDSDGDGRIDQHTEFDGYTSWPHWLKLERHGAHFSGYASADGRQWTKVGEAELRSAGAAMDAGIFTHQSSGLFEWASFPELRSR
jgi:alpha-galactosidase